MNRKRIGVGLIGLGRTSYPHEEGYRKVSDKAQILAVCDLDRKLAENRARPYNAKWYTDYRELLKNPDVNSVDIVLPHTIHYQVTKDALEFQKHVIVQKPITLVSEEALELIELAKNKDVKLPVAENTRFVKAYIEAEKLMRGSIIGFPRFIRTFISGSAVYRVKDPKDWVGHAEGSGFIMDAAPHIIYLLKWLFGIIKKITAFDFYLFEESDVEDTGIIFGRLKKCTLLSAEFSRTIETPFNERLEVYDDKGSLIIDQLANPPAVLFRVRKDMDVSSLRNGSRDPNYLRYVSEPISNVPYNPAGWKASSMNDEVVSFIEAILNNEAPAVDPMDAYYAVKVIEKAYESTISGKTIHL